VNEAPRLTPGRQAERAARDRRLAEALRANLRRRKEQARAREDETASSGKVPGEQDEER
jgi:hypothetical protein